MANFTTESEVREKFQLTDTTLVPAALVNFCENPFMFSSSEIEGGFFF